MTTSPEAPVATDRPTVLIVGAFPPPYGGIGTVLVTLCQSTVAAQFRLLRHTTNFPLRIRDLNRIGKPGKRYGDIFRGGLGHGLRLFGYAAGKYLQFLWTLVRERPALVHIHTASYWAFWRNAIYGVVARLTGRRVLLHIQCDLQQFYDRGSSLRQRAIRGALRVPHACVAQAPGLARRYQPLTPRPIHAVINGINLDGVSGVGLRRDQRDGRPPTILSVGDLCQEKGTADLIAAAAHIRPTHPDAEFHFVGQGDRPAFEALARRWGVADRVRFLGAVSEHEKWNAFKTASIFALPSYWEGSPISILEALAVGLPVVSTTVGGIPELIEEGRSGLLVSPGDVEGLAAALTRLLDDPTLRSTMGHTNRALVREHHDARHTMATLAAVYRACISNNGQVIGV